MDKKNSNQIGPQYIVLIIIGLLIIKFFNISYPISITNINKVTELSVVGEGRVEAIPDTSYVDLGIVVNNQSSVNEAQKQINEVNNRIILGLKKLNVQKKDIKTTNYSIYPNYSYINNQNVLDGYNGSVTVTVKVRSPDLVAQVIEVATVAGANQIQGTRFLIDDPNKYREEARSKAIENAKEQAQKMAKDLGLKLGKITNIVESAGSESQARSALKLMSSDQGLGGIGTNDFQQGSQTVTSVVTLYFEKN